MANYLYNNIELPELPASTSDVAVISSVLESASSMFGGASYIVTFGASILWNGGKCYMSNISGVYRYDGSAWVWHYGSGTTYTQDIIASGYFEAVWTNTNIPTEDGVSVYLAPSEPVKVGGESGGEEEEDEDPNSDSTAKIDGARKHGFIAGFATGLNLRGALKKKTIEVPAAHITFSSNQAFTLETGNGSKNWDGILYYSTDEADWNEWDGTSIASAEHRGEQRIYVRGVGNSIIAGFNTAYSWKLTGSNIRCIGNIETLLDYETVESGEHPTMAVGCYALMFYGSEALIEAPELPATSLADDCYHYMFANCPNLAAAPELPATNLAENCYLQMFLNCTSLTALPKLNATYLPLLCYAHMFNGCTGIKLSETQTGEYQTEYRVPASGTGEAFNDAVLASMFANTGGTFTGTPVINKTYYVISAQDIAEDSCDDAVVEIYPDVDLDDKFILTDNAGNITIGYMYGEAFTVTSYDYQTTDFRAIGWLRASYHTTGEYAGQITIDDFRTVESAGNNYIKNIQYCSREKLYYETAVIWPVLYFPDVKVLSIDYSNLENGTFTETLEDGRVITYTVTLDSSGRVTSITNGSHTTAVTW